MSTWCHFTDKKYFRLLFSGLFLLALSFVVSIILVPFASAEPNHQTISFQGRLLTKKGQPVADGRYNVQFVIYSGGNGKDAHNPGGETIWSETYLHKSSSTGVNVKDGYFTALLGSQHNFDKSIDWSSGKLWLSMNIAGKDKCQKFDSKDCESDGELLPMTRVTASAYAMSAGNLDGKTTSDLVQLGQGEQIDGSNNSSLFINKTGEGNLIQLRNNGDDTFTITNTGNIELGTTKDKSITLGKNDPEQAGKNLTISAGEAGKNASQAGGDLIFSGGSGSNKSRGGNIVLQGGSGGSGSVDGLVIIGTPTFAATTNDPNCYTDGQLVVNDCEIASDSVNNSATVIVGFSEEGKTATIPMPDNKMIGRVIYIIGASESEPFSLNFSDNGKMTIYPNTATSLMWTGDNWVAIGGSTPTKGGESSNADDKENQSNKQDDNHSNKSHDQSTDQTKKDDSEIIGSMFYDEKIGKIQCYQEEGWGDCQAAPDAFVTISPEYSGAVMNGNDIGTITSDLCSDELGINDGSNGQPAICDKNQTYNFYKWTTDEKADQTRSFYVSYKLPANFEHFVDSSTSLTARSDSNASIKYRLYRDSKDGLISCGDEVDASNQSGWHDYHVDNASDPANCNFIANDSLLMRIDLTAKDGANAYISDINFTYSSN